MASHNVVRALPRLPHPTRWPHPDPHRLLSTRRITTAASVDAAKSVPFVPPSPSPPLPSKLDRSQAIREAKPFSDFLTDTFNRQHDYLRISLTERCNLRCLYCMPEEGIQLSPNKDILTTAEIYYLSALFVNQGVNKIRLTGGEPTVRRDIIPLMQQLGSLRRNGLKEIALTTNGISLHRKLDSMVEAGLTGVNISLDTLDPHQFVLLTRRQGFDAVMKSITKVQEMNRLGAGIKLKINCVAMRGLNDHQILPFVEMTRDQNVEVRFIEYMPFGGNKWSEKKMLPYAEMLDLIRAKYPTISRLKGAKNDTSKTWQVPGFAGRVGFITSMTHNFCGSCNRLRITSDGNLKVCLHGNTEVSLRDLLRQDHGGEPMDHDAFEAIREVEMDRRKQQQGGLHLDGEEGWMSKERQLLEVIGAAVKRKKAAHAGMGWFFLVMAHLNNIENDKMNYELLSRAHFIILTGGWTWADPSSIDERSQPGNETRDAYKHSYISGRTMSWSRLPLHLLQPPSAHSNIRWYSTASRNPDEKDSDSGATMTTEGTTVSGIASTFGFQSLSSLFQQLPRGHYSRPSESDAEPETLGSMHQVPDQEVIRHPETKGVNVTFQSSPKPAVLETVAAEETLTSAKADIKISPPKGRKSRRFPSSLAQDSFQSPTVQRKDTATATFRRLSKSHATSPSQNTSNGMTATSTQANVGRGELAHKTKRNRRPNPFDDAKQQPRLDVVSSSMAWNSSPNSDSQKPWGLHGTDGKSMSPSSLLGATVAPCSETSRPERVKVAERIIKSARDLDRPVDTGQLTHVSSSGQAHMVDVGAKEQTKRVAIAVAAVRFSNPEPFKLISENNNKKGDVLGTARIAGVMAAKRTSDLIPLCHPLIISKVEVNVDLLPPGRLIESARVNEHGHVITTAQVDCVGPTGVEMEALTAASAAALTVYDMCKAVDRNMVIPRTQVVYKHGGKSGLHCYDMWASRVGKDFFKSRGLDVPGAAIASAEKKRQAAQKTRAAKKAARNKNDET